MTIFRYDYFGTKSRSFCLLNFFDDQRNQYDTTRLARASANICNELEPQETVVVIYETAKLVETASACHYTFPLRYVTYIRTYLEGGVG